MQPTRWAPFGLLTIIWMLLVFCESAVGFELKAGVHGMAWASPVADHGHLTLVRAEGPVGYYVNRNMMYRAANQPVPGVIYGFYQDRLFAVYIGLRSPNQAYYMEKRFSAEYGPARVTASNAGDQTIYRWQDEVVKIKLKIMESNDEMKLGIYYKPLVTHRNQAQMEEVTPDTFRNAPVKDKPAASAPLF